ncbi:hypothetical protein E2320_013669 [Naja naja]|nr:hypothetical protein E2320_013669 [Naja naja]
MEGDKLMVPPSGDQGSQRSSVSSTGPRAQDVLVYLVDDTVVRLTMDNLPSVTAHELHRMVLDVLKLPECALDIFSLWLISPFLEVQLKPKHQPYKICRQWQELLFRFTGCSVDEIMEDEPSLQFRRNIFFLRRKELQIQDEDVLRLLYEEAKYKVLEGRYPCDLADCDALGALVCRINLGPYNPEQHTASFLKEKLDCFLPSHLCHGGHKLFASLRKRAGSRGPIREQGLLRAFRELPEAGACEEHATLLSLYRAYLQKCHELPYYGGLDSEPTTAAVPTSDQQPAKIQRQSSVLRSRMQRLATIDYVEEAQLKAVAEVWLKGWPVITSADHLVVTHPEDAEHLVSADGAGSHNSPPSLHVCL